MLSDNPVIMSDMEGERISIRVNPGLRKKLLAYAASEGTSESDVVRQALEAYLHVQRRPVTCYDLAHRMGIIGRIKQSPTDLSTNRRYFKDFGR